MVKVSLIGAGKMGLSYLSLLGGYPEVEVIGVSDTSKMLLDVLKKYSFKDRDVCLPNFYFTIFIN